MDDLGCLVDLEGDVGQTVLRHGNRRTVEGVGLDDVGADLEVGPVGRLDHVGPGQVEDLVIA